MTDLVTVNDLVRFTANKCENIHTKMRQILKINTLKAYEFLKEKFCNLFLRAALERS